MLELWLQAADDPTLTLPVSLLDDGGDAVFGFLRSADPRAALQRQLGLIEPVLAEGGLAFDPADPVTDRARPTTTFASCCGARSRGSRSSACPVLLPRNWVASVEPAARQPLRLERRPSSGLLTTDALARFDWKLAIGDTPLTEEELAELAAAKEPLIRVRGRWHALRRSDVERALRFLDRRREGHVVDLVRAVSGIELEDIGLELGEVTLDDALGELLAGGDDSPLRAARDARLDDPAALPVPGARARVAAAARRPRHRRHPRRRHGAREDRAGDRDARCPSGSSSGRTPSARRSSSAR